MKNTELHPAEPPRTKSPDPESERRRQPAPRPDRPAVDPGVARQPDDRRRRNVQQ